MQHQWIRVKTSKTKPVSVLNKGRKIKETSPCLEWSIQYPQRVNLIGSPTINIISISQRRFDELARSIFPAPCCHKS